MMAELLILSTLLLPLLGGISGITVLKKQSQNQTVIFPLLSFISAVGLLVIWGTPVKYQTEWLPGVTVGIHIDKVSVVLLVLVTFVSLLVHLFSGTYMGKEAGKCRYFAKLGFFTFSMLGLLIVDDLFTLFIFWELVGLASYLLIGFWYNKEGVSGSARLAFMTNRIADVALLVGILWINGQSGSVIISELTDKWLVIPSVLVAVGAFGKSAQFPFSGWLTRAMVGPTPVSALIHAATMVAAGVYLLFRVAPFLSSEAYAFIAIIGALTALYGAVSALTQNDIKKVLAYSTISQLGYMIAGIGVGAPDASLFHLWTHAFFKAGLFLGAGSIIHYLHEASSEADAQDMRVMGGLKQKLPWTFRSFFICSLALAGIPLFSGFISKETIILSSWIWAETLGTAAYLIPDVLFITSLLTAFYVARMVILIFFGQSRLASVLDDFSYRETRSFIIPLMALAIGSFWFFYQLNPFGHHPYLLSFLGEEIAETSAFTKAIILVLSLFLAGGGGLLAWFLFKPRSKYLATYAERGDPQHPIGKLLFNGFYLTHAYESVGKGFLYVSRRIAVMDPKWIDGLVHLIGVGTVVFAKGINIFDRLVVDGLVNLLGWLSKTIGKLFSGVHSKELQLQIFWLLFAIILILCVILFF